MASCVPCGQTRESLTAATKCGETRTPEQESVIDHSLEALNASVARSADRLGRKDLLQVHQASAEVTGEPSVIATLQELRQSYGITFLGASVKTVEACNAALKPGAVNHLQIPVNDTRTDLVAWTLDNHQVITISGTCASSLRRHNAQICMPRPVAATRRNLRQNGG